MNKIFGKIVTFLFIQTLFCCDGSCSAFPQKPELTQNDRVVILNTPKCIIPFAGLIKETITHYIKVTPFLSETLKQVEYLEPNQYCEKTIESIMKLANGVKEVNNRYLELIAGAQNLPPVVENDPITSLLKGRYASLFEDIDQTLQLEDLATKNTTGKSETFEIIDAIEDLVNYIATHKKNLVFPYSIDELHKKGGDSKIKLLDLTLSSSKDLNADIKSYVERQYQNVNNLTTFLSPQTLDFFAILHLPQDLTQILMALILKDMGNEAQTTIRFSQRIIFPEELTRVLDELGTFPEIGIPRLVSKIKKAMGLVCEMYEFYNDALIKNIRAILKFPIYAPIDDEFLASQTYYKPNAHSERTKSLILGYTEWLQQINHQSHDVLTQIQHIPQDILTPERMSTLFNGFDEIYKRLCVQAGELSVDNRGGIHIGYSLYDFRQEVNEAAAKGHTIAQIFLGVCDKLTQALTTAQSIQSQIRTNEQDRDNEELAKNITEIQYQLSSLLTNLKEAAINGYNKIPTAIEEDLRCLEKERIRRSNYVNIAPKFKGQECSRAAIQVFNIQEKIEDFGIPEAERKDLEIGLLNYIIGKRIQKQQMKQIATSPTTIKKLQKVATFIQIAANELPSDQVAPLFNSIPQFELIGAKIYEIENLISTLILLYNTNLSEIMFAISVHTNSKSEQISNAAKNRASSFITWID